MRGGFRFLGFLLAIGVCAQQTRDLRLEPAARVNPLHDAGTRWAVVVGISRYANLPPAAQLHFADRDAEEFAGFLRSPAGGSIPGDHIRYLADEQATLAQVRAALDTWLPDAAGPEDVVYFYFAGHGVLDPADDQGYLVANDSDPQNLHATALPFDELDRTLNARVKARLVVMIADACHAGRLGWSTYTAGNAGRTADPLARIGQGDRSFLKLLASMPSERSFEDAKWDGGHGIFTHALLQGLEGAADEDRDRVVRVSEAIDYVSRRVPELTGAQQHPRVAGTFDARVALAASPQPAAAMARTVSLEVAGPPGSAVYLDNVFRGAIRPAGVLRIEGLAAGTHRLAADFADGAALEGSVTLGDAPARVRIASPAAGALGQLRALIGAGRVLEPNGAWDYFRSAAFDTAERPAAAAMVRGALEELGQACVSDYVQSTTGGLKGAMLQRAVDAWQRLETLRPNDSAMSVRRLFCTGRLRIAEGRFAEAVPLLEQALARDPRFACAYNALGAALGRTNRPAQAREAFETAARLTPEWGLPPFQIASQLIAAGNPAAAAPYLEKAAALNPRSAANLWNLLHVERLLGRLPDVERTAAALIQLNPNYAPAYAELGLAYEAAGNAAKAAAAYDTYVLLAPNFADTGEIRSRAEKLRAPPKKSPPSLLRK